MEAVGHPVRRLSRIGIGPVRLGNLAVGTTRDLTREELGLLLDLTSTSLAPAATTDRDDPSSSNEE